MKKISTKFGKLNHKQKIIEISLGCRGQISEKEMNVTPLADRQGKERTGTARKKIQRLLDMHLEQKIDFGAYEDKKKGDDYKHPRRNSKAKKLSSQPTDDSNKLSPESSDVAL